jgi:hypothetical protein
MNKYNIEVFECNLKTNKNYIIDNYIKHYNCFNIGYFKQRFINNKLFGIKLNKIN